MKKSYTSPIIFVERFAANEYIASACGDIDLEVSIPCAGGDTTLVVPAEFETTEPGTSSATWAVSKNDTLGIDRGGTVYKLSDNEYIFQGYVEKCQTPFSMTRGQQGCHISNASAANGYDGALCSHTMFDHAHHHITVNEIVHLHS